MRLRANGVALEVDVRGPADGAPLLMIMGLGMQLVAWPDELVERLVAAGFRVVRFDNRDAGLSQRFDAAGVPNLAWAALKLRLGLKLAPGAYTLDDMADDALGVLDALGIERAHLVGASMGGMIAMTLAARHPARVRSLVLMMTSSGARRLPRPTWAAQRALLARPQGGGLEALVDHLERVFNVIGSPAYREEPAAMRQRLAQSVRRAWNPAGSARQLYAVAAHGDRSPLLERIAAPTHLLHGRDDPLVPVAAAHDLQRKIRGATLEVIDGMGHDLPTALLPRIARSIADAAARG